MKRQGGEEQFTYGFILTPANYLFIGDKLINDKRLFILSI